MILDSHCHAWTHWPYRPEVPEPRTRGGVERLLWEMQQNAVAEALVVCAGIAHNPDNNTDVAAAVARHSGRLHQLADLDSRWTAHYHSGGAAARLAQMADTWPLAGFTHYLRDAVDGWLVSEAGIALFAEADRRRLIASLAANPAWHDQVAAVAHRFPDLPILLHHLGGIRLHPGGAEEGLRLALAAARAPNILFKLSGFYYGSARMWDFPHADAHWVIRRLYEAVGPNRLCWGSDFPVAGIHVTYRQTLEALRSHCPFIPSGDRDRIMGGTLHDLLHRA